MMSVNDWPLGAVRLSLPASYSVFLFSLEKMASNPYNPPPAAHQHTVVIQPVVVRQPAVRSVSAFRRHECDNYSIRFLLQYMCIHFHNYYVPSGCKPVWFIYWPSVEEPAIWLHSQMSRCPDVFLIGSCVLSNPTLV